MNDNADKAAEKMVSQIQKSQGGTHVNQGMATKPPCPSNVKNASTQDKR